MSKWTDWRRLADKKNWYNDKFDYDGPACYELGVGGPRRGAMKSVYVGETKNEKTRLTAYARHGSHLSGIIDDVLRKGWTLFYRAQAMPSKAAASRMQDNLLGKYNYDWNLQLNADDED